MPHYRIGDAELELVGALSQLPVGNATRPQRLPESYWPEIPSRFMEAMIVSAAGVRLRFATEATNLALELATHPYTLNGGAPFPAAVDLVIDGETVQTVSVTGAPAALDTLADTFEIAPGEPTRVEFAPLPAGAKVVELWLPHTAVVEIAGLETDSPISAAPPVDTTRWLHHGSSISHCLEALSPTRTWPARAASALGVDLLDLAYAGNAVLDPFVARTIRDEPADLITLKLGINLVNADLMRLRAFVPAVHGFLDTVREGHPETPIVVISPIVCPIVETVPGPTIPDPVTGELISGAADPDFPGALTLSRIRDALAAIVSQRSSADANLYYLDGRELFAEPDIADGHLPDGLHPDDEGYRRMGERFAKLLPGIVALGR